MEKDDAYKTLETINKWIENCDTKTSIILGSYGVIISVLYSHDYFENMQKHIQVICHNQFDIHSFILLISMVLFCIGVLILISVLIPKKDLSRSSLIFWGSVSQYKTFNNYKQHLDNYDDKKIKEDLVSQIYASAKICNHKFSFYKFGMLLSMSGMIVNLCVSNQLNIF